MNKQFFRVAGIAAFALLACTSLWAQGPASGAVQAETLQPAVLQQIAAITSVKASFTAAQKKMSSPLAFGILAAGNDPRVAGFVNAIAPLGADAPGIAPHPGGRPGLTKPVTIDIFGRVNDTLLNGIAAAKGVVLYQSSQWGVVIASVPIGSVASIAALPDVTRVRTPGHASTNAGNHGNNGPHTNVGLVTSQGYIAHEANKVINNLPSNGTGVTVGVLSDSATPARVAALIASGDLPVGATSLPGQSGPSIADGGEDEGTAMMEIVHDMAPGAQVLFATAFTSEFSFADNIIALAAAGCKVIVDDVTYFDEPVFQDGVIAQAVNQVTAAGVTYFSAAANSGNLTSNSSGTWEGDFLDGGPVSGVITTTGETGDFHNFRTVASPQNFDVLTVGTIDINLKWSDPLGASTNDYDLFLLNSTGTTVLAFSAGVQSGTQDPEEEIFSSTGFLPGSRVVVVLFNGVQRALHIDTERGELSINTSGATFGHNAGANTVSMAATYWNSAREGTQPFTGFANPNEFFSSDGPRRIFFNPDGSAITPGNFLFSNGGTTLTKPDLAAADGVTALTPGFNPFFGTSAAAPHGAAIAALILSARPDYTVAQVKTAMMATALDSMEPGVDRDSGYGITMAWAAVQYALTH